MAATLYTLPATQPAARVVARTVERFYAPELDVLRFGAFLLVFCRHVVNALGDARRLSSAPAAPGNLLTQASSSAGTLHSGVAQSASGWTRLQEALQCLDFGVCLFFFLSAFLITRLLLLERQASGTVAVRSFYIRRALRIWPLYFSFLLAIMLLAHALPLLWVSSARMLAAAVFVANWAAVLHGWQGIAIQPLWSVSVEEQFYAVWPWIARHGRTMILALSCALGVAGLITLTYLGHRPGTLVTAVWPNTLVQGLFLAGGALIACLSHPERRQLSGGFRACLLLAGFALWIAASAGFHVVRFASPGSGNLVAGYLLVLAGTYLIFTGVAGWNRRELPRVLIHLGRISYGLYVFHVAVLLALYDLAKRVLPQTHGHLGPYLQVAGISALGLLVTTVLASLSYRFLESPFLRLKDRFAVVASRPV